MLGGWKFHVCGTVSVTVISQATAAGRATAADDDAPRPDVSVIVVTHEGRELALATLRSAQAALGGARAEFLVVDSGSTDGTPDAIERELPWTRVFRSSNRGFAAGNNVALPHARGRYVLLLNPDVEIRSGTLAQLVATMDARSAVGLASVVQQGTDGQLLPSIRRFPTVARSLGEALGAARFGALSRLQELDTGFGRYGQERSVEWLVGAFLIVRREALQEVGPLDEGFFLYSEETDWCRRFRARGWDVRHLPGMVVVHRCGNSTRPDLVAQLSHSRRRFAYKHLPWPQALGVHTALALKHVLRLLAIAPPALVRPRLRQRVRAEARGLAVLLGARPPYG
jgi:GT2 family glycosyltransferase